MGNVQCEERLRWTRPSVHLRELNRISALSHVQSLNEIGAYVKDHERHAASAHRDVKPHNVLLRARGAPGGQPRRQGRFQAVLMDFGSCQEGRIRVRTRSQASPNDDGQ